jgi:hypothetical protein
VCVLAIELYNKCRKDTVMAWINADGTAAPCGKASTPVGCLLCCLVMMLPVDFVTSPRGMHRACALWLWLVICIEVVSRGFHCMHIMYHWVLLADRWLMALQCMSDERMAHCA